MEGANSSPLTRSCPLPLWRYRENAGMHCWLRRARMDLAFTDSRPGTEGCRLVHVPDARGRAGAIMTDGCGFLSAAVMRAAWSALDGTGPVPCALQGRLGGCKGVWVALPDGCMAYPPDRHWVAERPSQRKVHLPTPSPECVCAAVASCKGRAGDVPLPTHSPITALTQAAGAGGEAIWQERGRVAEPPGGPGTAGEGCASKHVLGTRLAHRSPPPRLSALAGSRGERHTARPAALFIPHERRGVPPYPPGAGRRN